MLGAETIHHQDNCSFSGLHGHIAAIVKNRFSWSSLIGIPDYLSRSWTVWLAARCTTCSETRQTSWTPQVQPAKTFCGLEAITVGYQRVGKFQRYWELWQSGCKAISLKKGRWKRFPSGRYGLRDGDLKIPSVPPSTWKSQPNGPRRAPSGGWFQ